MQRLFQDDSDHEPIELDEGRGTTSLKLSSRDRQRLLSSDAVLVNIADDGTTFIRAKNSAGVIGLSDAPDLYLRPKIQGTNLLYLLLYARGVESTLGEEPTNLEEAGSVIDLLAVMYIEELRTALDRGPTKSYEQTVNREQYLRGTLDLQRQLQRDGPAPTKFTCRYAEHTTDNIFNQTILYAGWLLLSAASLDYVQRRLQPLVTRLRRLSTLRVVEYEELEQIQITRLEGHYREVLQLAETVIANSFIENIDVGPISAYGFTLETPPRFQEAVHQAVQNATGNHSAWTVPSAEYHLQDFVTGDVETSLQVDSVVCENGSPAVAIDAKYTELDTDSRGNWSPDSDHLHKMASYTEYLDVPGILVYPELDDGTKIRASASFESGHELRLHSVPTITDNEDYHEYRDQMNESLEPTLLSII